MKLKQGIAYYASDYKKSVIIFYIVIAALIVLSLILSAVLVHGDASFSGQDMSTFIFLFVLGLNGFKPQLLIMLQNGLSRRTLWCSFVVTAIAVAGLMGLINALLPLALGGPLEMESTYHMLYNGWGQSYRFTLTGLVWNCAMGLAAMSFGFFLTTLYYRMSKLLKVLVSVGVPALLFIVLPIVEATVPSFHGFTSLMKAFAWAMGFSLTSLSTVFPWRAVASAAVLSAVSAGLAFLLIRRATPKTV